MTSEYHQASDQTSSNKNNQKKSYWCWSYSAGGIGTGILLVATGAFFLAREMRWISEEIPFWPLAIVVVGLLMIFKRS